MYNLICETCEMLITSMFKILPKVNFSSRAPVKVLTKVNFSFRAPVKVYSMKVFVIQHYNYQIC